MHIALLSPYHGGSHRAWAEGYQRHSRHHIHLFTLPARYWKWRMHGGAVTLARQFAAYTANSQNPRPDVLLVTDMLDLSTFRALAGPTPPAVLYMHENQLTYPLPAGAGAGPMRRQHGERDYHYAFINVASMLAANEIWFNSRFHHDSWFAALPRYLNRFPEYKELDTVPLLQSRSQILPPGLDLAALHATQPNPHPVHPIQETPPKPENATLSIQKSLPHPENPVPQKPLILWNQRWEYDKDPAGFFQALYTVQDEGYDFRLALCGQNFRRRPREFDEALERLAGRIIHSGHAPEAQYHALLWEADITISTARHEFFGISILEAVAAHTFPILPRRLSYPELIPEPYHLRCLYDHPAGLLDRLRWALTHPAGCRSIATALAESVQRFAWPVVANQYDQRIVGLTGNRRMTADDRQRTRE